MKVFFVPFFIFFLSQFSFSQMCTEEEMKIYPMLKKKQPDSLLLKGEWTVKLNSNPKSVDDLSEKDIRAIKKIMAKYDGCVAYLDFNGYWRNKKGELYFYFGILE